MDDEPGDRLGDSRIGSVLDGRYRVLARIAAGGMGMVYRGERIGIGKPVAIKFLHRSAARDPEHRRRFEREAEAMSRVTHPNLVSVIDHGVADGIPYLIMEYHQGASLRVMLDRGPIKPVRAVAIARWIAAGVQGIHAAGVMHRDLKPENVLLLEGLEQDFAKVLDFGIAKIFDADNEIDVTRAGHVVGTPSYMSPEQARGAKVDHRTDIYSIGVLMFEMVTGERPFEGDEDLAVLRQHVEVLPQAPRSVGGGDAISEQLEEIILTALEKSPAARYQSAAELGKALLSTPEHRTAALLRRAATESDPPAKASRARPKRRRRSVLGLLFAVAIGVGIGWVARDPRVIARFHELRGDAPIDAGAAKLPVDAGIPLPPAVPVDASVDAGAASVATRDAAASVRPAIADAALEAPDAGPHVSADAEALEWQSVEDARPLSIDAE